MSQGHTELRVLGPLCPAAGTRPNYILLLQALNIKWRDRAIENPTKNSIFPFLIWDVCVRACVMPNAAPPSENYMS